MDFIVWIVIAVALSILEIILAGFFMLFFGIGAAITAIAAIFIKSLSVQLTIFLGASIILLLFGRPLLKKTFQLEDRPPQPSNVDKLLGEGVLALEAVNRYGGRVKVLHSGESWSAYLDPKAINLKELPQGSEGIIVAVDGAKLVIGEKTP